MFIRVYLGTGWLDGSGTLRQFSVYNLITPAEGCDHVTMSDTGERLLHMDLILNHKTLRQVQTLRLNTNIQIYRMFPAK